MGLLKLGKPLKFDSSKEHLKYVREHGVDQFLSTWNRVKDIANDDLKWGDEIECGVISIDSTLKTAKIAIRSKDILQK